MFVFETISCLIKILTIRQYQILLVENYDLSQKQNVIPNVPLNIYSLGNDIIPLSLLSQILSLQLEWFHFLGQSPFLSHVWMIMFFWWVSCVWVIIHVTSIHFSGLVSGEQGGGHKAIMRAMEGKFFC